MGNMFHVMYCDKKGMGIMGLQGQNDLPDVGGTLQVFLPRTCCILLHTCQPEQAILSLTIKQHTCCGCVQLVGLLEKPGIDKVFEDGIE